MAIETTRRPTTAVVAPMTWFVLQHDLVVHIKNIQKKGMEHDLKTHVQKHQAVLATFKGIFASGARLSRTALGHHITIAYLRPGPQVMDGLNWHTNHKLKHMSLAQNLNNVVKSSGNCFKPLEQKFW